MIDFRRLFAAASCLRLGVGLALAGGLLLAGCEAEPARTAAAPGEIVFSIPPIADPAAAIALWEPLLADLSREVGVTARPFATDDYDTLIEAMRFDRVQAGWFSAPAALQAVERAGGEAAARAVDLDGKDSYVALLVVQRGSGVTLDEVLRCGARLDFGRDDAPSSGARAAMTFLFRPRGIDPADCFRTVRSGDAQANLAAVASGVLSVAVVTSVEAGRLSRETPKAASQIEAIWNSPALPQAGVVVRRDLDPALKERLRSFFLTYGQGQGAEAERQRLILRQLRVSGFEPAGAAYLDPLREIRADEALRVARAAGDTEAAEAAETQLNALRARREVQP